MPKTKEQSPTSPAASESLKLTSAKTCAKYGLTQDGFLFLAKRQGYVCAICKKLPSSGRLVIDHDHAKGWNKMPPEERRRYVRGACCWNCNYRFLAKGMNIEKAQNLVDYLKAHAKVQECS